MSILRESIAQTIQPSIKADLINIIRSARSMGVYLELSLNPTKRVINLSYIAREKAPSGYGSTVINQLIDVANSNGYKIAIDVDIDYNNPARQAKLIQYYTRHGFVLNTKDYYYDSTDEHWMPKNHMTNTKLMTYTPR
jgi:predicted GNAT family N-acyltransferase